MSAVLDFPVKPEARPYLDAFDKGVGHISDAEPRWLARNRRRGITRFAELGFPTRRSESWRYLDFQPLQQRPLLPLDPVRDCDLDAARAQLARLDLPGRGLRLVMVDGLFAEALSTVDMRLGGDLWFGPFSYADAEKEELH